MRRNVLDFRFWKFLRVVQKRCVWVPYEVFHVLLPEPGSPRSVSGLLATCRIRLRLWCGLATSDVTVGLSHVGALVIVVPLLRASRKSAHASLRIPTRDPRCDGICVYLGEHSCLCFCWLFLFLLAVLVAYSVSCWLFLLPASVGP